MREVISPERYVCKTGEISVFAAGSIEQGKAIDWQKSLKEKLSDQSDVVLFNPRRAAWDASWVQDLTNPQFVEQVNWEQDHIERESASACHIVFINIDPKTKSIITFGEFAQVYNSGNVVINCPLGYWRRGNIEVMAQRAGLRLHTDFDESVETLKNMIQLTRDLLKIDARKI
jgi:hypothetical protein